jgi:hypothetical protein
MGTNDTKQVVVGLAGRIGRTRMPMFVTGYSWNGDVPSKFHFHQDSKRGSSIRLKTALRVAKHLRACGYKPFIQAVA